MAVSGSVSSPTTVFGSFIRLDWERTATNTTLRTSTIRYRLYLCLRNGNWIDARESGRIETIDGTSAFSRGTTHRGPNGDHLLYEYTNTVYHYDEYPIPIGYYGVFKSGWTEFGSNGTIMTGYGISSVDAMAYPIPPTSPSYPAKYWVGGTGTWNNTAGSKWATTPGGPGGAPVPAAGDNVVVSGNVTLAVDTPGLRDVNIGGTFNANGKTLRGRRIEINDSFSLGSGRLEGYNSVTFTGGTANLGSGTVEVLNGGAIDFSGWYIPGGFEVWSGVTMNAGDSTIIVNANGTGGSPMGDTQTLARFGNKTYNRIRINLGTANSENAIVEFGGAPTVNVLDIRSMNGGQNDVEFDSGTLTVNDMLLAIGAEGSSNKLSLTDGNSGASYSIMSIKAGSVYGANISMSAGIGSGSYSPLRIGSNSVKYGSAPWVIADHPKSNTLVQDFTSIPSLDTNIWDTANSIGTVALVPDEYLEIWDDANSMSAIATKETYDISSTPIVVKYNRGPSPSGVVMIGIETILGGIPAFVMETGDGTPHSGYVKIEIGDSVENHPGQWLNYYTSTNGHTWNYSQGTRIDSGIVDEQYYRSVRLALVAQDLGGGDPAILRIESINILPPEQTNTGNFLMFFGGL